MKAGVVRRMPRLGCRGREAELGVVLCYMCHRGTPTPSSKKIPTKKAGSKGLLAIHGCRVRRNRGDSNL